MCLLIQILHKTVPPLEDMLTGEGWKRRDGLWTCNDSSGCREQAEQEAELEEAIAKATEEIIDKFEEQWKPAMENLQEAEHVFDDLDGEHTPETLSPNMHCKRGVLLGCAMLGCAMSMRRSLFAFLSCKHGNHRGRRIRYWCSPCSGPVLSREAVTFKRGGCGLQS